MLAASVRPAANIALWKAGNLPCSAAASAQRAASALVGAMIGSSRTTILRSGLAAISASTSGTEARQ